MQIVIDIPDAPIKDYQDLFYKIHGMAAREGLFDDKVKSQRALALKVVLDILDGIVNGTPLPRHGRLIDADNMKTMKNIQSANFNAVELIRLWIDKQDTIIEADKEYEAKVISGDDMETLANRDAIGYEECFTTGNYEDQECGFCPHRGECSGWEEE